jgi:hypothetical protein
MRHAPVLAFAVVLSASSSTQGGILYPARNEPSSAPAFAASFPAIAPAPPSSSVDLLPLLAAELEAAGWPGGTLRVFHTPTPSVEAPDALSASGATGAWHSPFSGLIYD